MKIDPLQWPRFSAPADGKTSLKSDDAHFLCNTLLFHSSPHHSAVLFKSPVTFMLPNIVIDSRLALNLASYCHLALLITPSFLELLHTGVAGHCPFFFLFAASYQSPGFFCFVLFCFSPLPTSNEREPQGSGLNCLLFFILIPRIIL